MLIIPVSREFLFRNRERIYSIEKLYRSRGGLSRISNRAQFFGRNLVGMIVALPVKKSIASSGRAMHFNGKLALNGTNFPE